VEGTSPSPSATFEETLEELRGYDMHPSMFAPSGRILQVEYAMEVSQAGAIVPFNVNAGRYSFPVRAVRGRRKIGG
jgi:hypothetical protein